MSHAAPLTCRAHAVKCELATDVLCSEGTLRLQVIGWSMFPAIQPGDTLLVDRVRGATVSAGDVVLFARDRRLFTHRVIANDSVTSSEIATRGDAMPRPDPPFDESELLGKVSFIERNGTRFRPSRTRGKKNRVLGALMGYSDVAFRVIVKMHGLLQALRIKRLKVFGFPCPS